MRAADVRMNLIPPCPPRLAFVARWSRGAQLKHLGWREGGGIELASVARSVLFCSFCVGGWRPRCAPPEEIKGEG